MLSTKNIYLVSLGFLHRYNNMDMGGPPKEL